jgi:hypothetical protein
MFANAPDFAHLYPNAAPAPIRYYAQRLQHGPVVDAVRHRLTQRAANLGYTPTRAHTLYLTDPGVTHVAIHPGVSELHLRSTTRTVSGDARTLGALVVGLRLDGHEVALNDISLARGFHPAETHGTRLVRWTDGNGVITFHAAPAERWMEIDVSAIMALELA